MAKKALSSIFLFALFHMLSFTQLDKINTSTEWDNTLTGSLKSKIDKAQAQLNKADGIYQQAVSYEDKAEQFRSSGKKGKVRKYEKMARKKKMQAFVVYEIGHNKMYRAYNKSLKSYRGGPSHSDAGIDIERNAFQAFKRAKKLQRKGKDAGNEKQAYEYLSEAYNNEVKAINMQIDAYYAYEGKEQTTETFVTKPDKNIQSNFSRTDSLLLAFAKKQSKQQTPENTDEAVTNTEQITPPPVTSTVQADIPVEEEEIIEEPVKKEENIDVFFSIQILSKTIPATEAQIKNVYKGSEEVFYLRSDGYYRYMIGKFATLFEAKMFKNQRNINGFLVAYKNNQRITIKEAVELVKQ